MTTSKLITRKTKNGCLQGAPLLFGFGLVMTFISYQMASGVVPDEVHISEIRRTEHTCSNYPVARAHEKRASRRGSGSES